MKIEAEIPDINRDEVIEAMARQLLSTWVEEELDPDEGGGTARYQNASPLAEQLRVAVTARIDQLADKLVRDNIETVAQMRISDAVTSVIAEGWRKTDNYGNATGDVIDLKGRISEVITEKKSGRYGEPHRTLAERLVIETVEKCFREHFEKEVQSARDQLRNQLNKTIADKFAETVKQALGIR